MRISLCVLAALLAAACSDTIGVNWKRKLQAPSVSTPLVTDSFIAVGHETGLAITERDGTPRCVFPTHREVISAPATDGKHVFFGSTNYIFYAIDSGCTERWKFPTGDRIKSDPLVHDGRVFLSSYDGHVYALNAETGEQLWRFPPAAAVDLNLPPPESEKPSKSKRRRKRGTVVKEKEKPEPEATPALPPIPTDVGDFSYSSPVLVGKTVYLGNLDHHMYAISAETGDFLGRFKTNGPITSTGTEFDGTLFFGSNDGSVYALDLSANRIRWKLATKDWVNSSPRVIDGVLFVGSNDRHIYAADTTSGRLMWKYETEGPAIARPVGYKNLIVAAGSSGDGTIYALQRQTGELFWRYETGGKIDADPVVVGDKLYVASADRHLYSFTFKKTTAE